MAGKELYQEMVELNGTYQNVEIRRMNPQELEELAQYAETQPLLPGETGVHFLARKARREIARRIDSAP